MFLFQATLLQGKLFVIAATFIQFYGYLMRCEDVCLNLMLLVSRDLSGAEYFQAYSLTCIG